jgi:hypothetical protein
MPMFVAMMFVPMLMGVAVTVLVVMVVVIS